MPRFNLGLGGPNDVTPPTEEQLEQASEPYLKTLGRVVFSWNRMQEKLAFLFYTVGTFKDEDVARAIWHSTPNDRSQRQMLRAAVDTLGGKDDPKMSDIIWMINKIDNMLSARRNDAIHAAYDLVTDAWGNRETHFVPDRWSGNPKSQSFEGKNLIDEFEWLAKCTEHLAECADSMAYHLVDDDAAHEDLYDEDGNENYPWPDKPSLPQKPDKKNS